MSSENGQIADLKERARRVAGGTVPGKSNDRFVERMGEIGDVVGEFIDDTNNWFEIVDVRHYREDKIGIPCRWRWTIKRWVVQDMDQWLIDNGWMVNHHLRADSRTHRENELEARFSKEFGKYTVYINAYVEMTDDVFESLQKGEPIRAAKEKRRINERLDELRQARRSEGEA